MPSYSDKLKDPRWQRKRLEILQACNWRCEDCGRSDKELQIHHSCYIRGRKLWEYELDLLMCLCPDCHLFRQGREEAIRVSLAKILRFLEPKVIEEEAWRIISDIAERQTARMAESFS